MSGMAGLRYFSIIVVLYLCSRISCIDTFLLGQTVSDDPNGCLWFHDANDKMVMRCCDGYFKSKAMDQGELCIECPYGFYGFFCQDKCPCRNATICDKVNGSCECQEGYFGKSCELSCNCENGANCLPDGSCSCLEGYYGELCEFKCSCPANQICRGINGECTCREGFFGDLCLPCKCSNGDCNKRDGLCMCKPGYYGKHCSEKCSCYNGAVCIARGSECKCHFGWTGSNCTICDTSRVSETGQHFCDNKCLHCYNGDTCSVHNGDCLCTPGWLGNKCDGKCRQGYFGWNCREICRCANGNCDHVTGKCDCEVGWTGHQCKYPCPDNCVACEDDICTSCKPGWTGVRCYSPCKAGFYGNSCLKQCPNCLYTDTCHHISGTCMNSASQTSAYPNDEGCLGKISVSMEGTELPWIQKLHQHHVTQPLRKQPPD